MKKKSLFPLLMVVPMVTACGNNGPVGMYAFQMGKEKGTHMGVYLELSDKPFDASKPEKGNGFTLTLDMITAEGDESDLGLILQDFNPIKGYYFVKPEEQVYEGTRLGLGLELLGEYDIPETITDLLFVANISDTLVNFYLPVSLADLRFQLYWYGYDLNLFDPSSSEDVSPFSTPEGPHPVGTHPTEEDIAQINTHYPDEHGGAKFRDYHVLQLGLTKK